MSELVLTATSKLNAFVLCRPRLLNLIIFVVAVMAVSLFIVWSRIHFVNLEYEISSLDSQIRTMTQEEKKLRLEAASLGRLTRIESLAKRQGLSRPLPEQIRYVY